MDRNHYLALVGLLFVCAGLVGALVRPSVVSRWPSSPAHRFYSPSGTRVVFDYQPSR